MFLSDISVKRPVLAAVMSMLIALAGVVAFLQLSIREYPDTDPPIVSVETVYRGAAANVIESRITQVIEDRISGIEGVQTITSRSEDGQSDISIEFRPGRSIDEAANDVRDRIGGVLDELPDEADPPEVRKVDADASPIVWFNVTAPGWTNLQISDYVDRYLVDRFSSLDGVARVSIGGEARPSMRIWLNAPRLAAFSLTPNDVESALRGQNVELPAGRIEAVNQNVTLRVNRPYTTAQQFRELVIGRGDDGYLVRLGDVARVEEGPENPYSTFRSNGVPGVGIGIIRQSGANTLAVAQAAKDAAAQLGSSLPRGMWIDVANDSSLFIERAIANVYETLAEAAFLVVVVIFVFLGSARATLIPAITVPICLLATFAVLWVFGFSINLLTLLALVLAIGLVVDDAIVVLENVYHRIEQGEPPLTAAFKGTRQVGFAVLASTAVVCAVFVPVMFLAGTTGLLFRELAAAMIGAVAFSGFLALTLTPMLCSKMIRKETRKGVSSWLQTRFERLESRYDVLIGKALLRPLPTFIGVGVLIAVAGGLFLTLRSELAPAEDTGAFMVSLSAPEGTGFNQMDSYVRQAEKIVLPMVEDGPVRRAIGRTPGSFSASEDFNNGRIVVFLQPWEERDQTTQEVVNEVNKGLATIPGVRGNATQPSSLGRGRGQPINFVIAGGSYAELAKARDRIIAAAARNPGILDLDSDYKATKPQLLLDVDTTRAGDLGVSVDAISQALQTMMGSRRVTTYVERGEEYRVVIQADAEARANERDLTNVYVRSRSDALVPLANLVSFRDAADARELGRYNKMRAITLTGSLASGYTLGEALEFLENEAAGSPEVTAVGYRGESQSYKETGGSIALVLALTILLIYLLLAAQFESFVHPGVIITTVPLAVAGGVIGLALMGQTLNLYSQIGIVMLVGLAAKNGILIVEFANQLRDEGHDILEATRIASVRRLRPILMTSIATVAGALPLMLATGAGAAARRSIGVVVVSGVSLATLITLLLIPILYLRLGRNTGSPQAVARKLDAELSRVNAGEGK